MQLHCLLLVMGTIQFLLLSLCMAVQFLNTSGNKVTFDRVAYFGFLETEQIISAPRHAPVGTLGAFSPYPPSTAIAFLHQLAYNIEVTQGVPRLRLRWGFASDPHNLMKLILT